MFDKLISSHYVYHHKLLRGFSQKCATMYKEATGDSWKQRVCKNNAVIPPGDAVTCRRRWSSCHFLHCELEYLEATNWIDALERTQWDRSRSKSSLNKTKGISHGIKVWKGAMNVSCHPATDIKDINIVCKEKKLPFEVLRAKTVGEKGRGSR